MSKQVIRAKVAAVVTPTSVVINRGRNDGVTQGMKFGVYYTFGPITDPDDPSNIIPELTFRKGTITATRTYNRMTFCSLDPVSPSRPWMTSLPFSPEPAYPPVERPMYAEEDKTIRVGDTVEQIEEPIKAAPSIEGLWTVEFQTKGGENGGVAVLEGGRIRGGDSGYYYVGRYTLSGETVSGDVQAEHYHGPSVTAFGDQATKFSLTIAGKLSTNRNQITGTVERANFGQVQFRMTRRPPLS